MAGTGRPRNLLSVSLSANTSGSSRLSCASRLTTRADDLAKDFTSRDNNVQGSKSMNSLNRCGVVSNGYTLGGDNPRERSRSAVTNTSVELFAGAVVINDRIISDDEIGIKVMANFISRVKQRLLKPDEDTSQQDSGISWQDYGVTRQRTLSASPQPEEKRRTVQQRYSLRRLSTRTRGDSKVSSGVAETQTLKRRKLGQAEVNRTSDTADIVIRMKDYELVRQLYDRDSTAKPKLRIRSLPPPRRSLSSSLRLVARPHSVDNSRMNYGKVGLRLDEQEDTANPDSCNTYTDAAPTCSAPPQAMDDAMTLRDACDADFDAQVLGELIQRHLQQLIDSRVGSIAEPMPRQGGRRHLLLTFANRLACSCCRDS